MDCDEECGKEPLTDEQVAHYTRPGFTLVYHHREDGTGHDILLVKEAEPE